MSQHTKREVDSEIREQYDNERPSKKLKPDDAVGGLDKSVVDYLVLDPLAAPFSGIINRALIDMDWQMFRGPRPRRGLWIETEFEVLKRHIKQYPGVLQLDLLTREGATSLTKQRLQGYADRLLLQLSPFLTRRQSLPPPQPPSSPTIPVVPGITISTLGTNPSDFFKPGTLKLPQPRNGFAAVDAKAMMKETINEFGRRYGSDGIATISPSFRNRLDPENENTISRIDLEDMNTILYEEETNHDGWLNSPVVEAALLVIAKEDHRATPPGGTSMPPTPWDPPRFFADGRDIKTLVVSQDHYYAMAHDPSHIPYPIIEHWNVRRLLLFPICARSHWSLIGIEFGSGRYWILDSMMDARCRRQLDDTVRALEVALSKCHPVLDDVPVHENFVDQARYARIRKDMVRRPPLRCVPGPGNQQSDRHSCGVWAVYNGIALIRRRAASHLKSVTDWHRMNIMAILVRGIGYEPQIPEVVSATFHVSSHMSWTNSSRGSSRSNSSSDTNSSLEIVVDGPENQDDEKDGEQDDTGAEKKPAVSPLLVEPMMAFPFEEDAESDDTNKSKDRKGRCSRIYTKRWMRSVCP